MSEDQPMGAWARPFLEQMSSPPQTQSIQAPTESEDDDAEAVRPYFLTGGRVHDGVGGFETVHLLTEDGERAVGQLAFERRQIAELCRTPQSVAEISALLHLPLGVATVLTRDLVAGGYLRAAVTMLDPTSDPALIKRLIHAVHAL
jgi:hypothetical protein